MTLHRYNSELEAAQALIAGVSASGLKSIKTKAVAKVLESIGFTVYRGAEKLEIHADKGEVHMPDVYEAKNVKNLYFTLAEAIMSAQNYGELTHRIVCGSSQYDKSQMFRSRFEKFMPRIIAGIPLVAKQFEAALSTGMLRMVQGTNAPGQISGAIKHMNIPGIPFDSISEGMFGIVTLPGGERVDAPMENFHWLVSTDAVRKHLLTMGANPNKIWNADRIIREATLDVQVKSLIDLKSLLLGSTLEDDTLLIPVLNGSRNVIVRYANDPDPMPNDIPAGKVWSIQYGKQEFILADNQFVDGYGPVPVTSAIWAMVQYITEVQSEDQITGRIALSAPSLFRQAFYTYAHGDNKIKTAVKDAVGVWQIVCSLSDYNLVLKEDTSPEVIASAGAAFLSLGIPAIADAQVKRLYVKNGAIMRGFNLRWNEQDKSFYVVNCNDQSKPGKFTNRGGLMTNWQAYVYKNGTNSYYHQEGKDLKMTYGAETILETSGFRLVGNRGQGVANDGVRCRIMITNWVGENGSGVVSAHPTFALQIGVRKKVSFNEIAVYCAGMDPVEHYNKYFKAEELKKTVVPGQSIAWFNGVPIAKFQPQDSTSGTFTEDAPTEVDGDDIGLDAYGVTGNIIAIEPGEPTNIQADSQGRPISYDVSGSITILTTYLETAAKLREAGVKWTCLQEELDIYDIMGNLIQQPDMVVGTENAKQDDNMLTLLKMWADSIPGGVDYNTQTDLTPEQQESFAKWRYENTSQMWIWTPPMQKPQFMGMLTEYCGRTDFDFDMANRRVGQLCWVTQGDMVLSVEVSTVRENMGKQASIAEQLAALACVYRPFAMDLYAGNAETRKAVLSSMAMACNDGAPIAWVKGASDNPVIPFDQRLLEEKGPRAVFKKLHAAFPEGLVIVDDRTDNTGNLRQLTLRFDALAKFSVGADRTGNSVIMLLQHIALADQQADLDQWDNLLSRKIGMARGGIAKWATSNGNLKAMTRTDKILHGRKVKTTARATIKPGEVGLNPNDPLVNMYDKWLAEFNRRADNIMEQYHAGFLTIEQVQIAGDKLINKFKRKGLTAGDHILISRSPMISVVLLKVVITDKAPIGTYLMSDWDWHRGNEGDGDGDPSAGLLVPAEDVDAIRKSLRTSVFGINGYYVAWGTNIFNELPIMDFYRGQDKKATAYMDLDMVEYVNGNRVVTYKGTGTMALKPHTGCAPTKIDDAVSIFERIGMHYTRFVGKSFAMASALTFKVEYLSSVQFLLNNWDYYAEENGWTEDNYNFFYNELLDGADYGSACAKVWRRMYEGLALSGISVKAEKFADEIRQIGNSGGMMLSQKYGQVDSDTGLSLFDTIKKTTGMVFETFPSKEDPTIELAWLPGQDAVVVAFGMADIALIPNEAKAIYWSILVTTLYSRIERMDTETDFDAFIGDLPDHLADVVDDALTYGTLRRAGAGMSKRPDTMTAMPSLVHPDAYGMYLPTISIMGSIFNDVAPLQAEAETLRANMLYN